MRDTTLGLALLLTLATTPFANAEEKYDGDLSPSEIALCRKTGCFGQGVSENVIIESIGAEVFHTDPKSGDRFVLIPVTRKDISIEYTILQWIGNGREIDAVKLANARAFANALESMRQKGRPVNLVVQGSANQMTAEFPIIGFFSKGGDYFFQDRVTAPLLTKL